VKATLAQKMTLTMTVVRGRIGDGINAFRFKAENLSSLNKRIKFEKFVSSLETGRRNRRRELRRRLRRQEKMFKLLFWFLVVVAIIGTIKLVHH